MSQTREQVMEKCIGAEVPAGPINSIADIFEDPHFRAREQLLTITEPDTGPVVIPGVIPKLSATPGRVNSLGQALGASNNEVWGGLLGLTDAEIADLRARGVI